MHHRIRSRPPFGGAVLATLAVVLGLLGFVIAEVSGRGAWAVVGGVVLGLGLIVLVALAIIWLRGALVIDTTDTGFTATATGQRVTTRWDEVSAVTATEDELRVRRNAGQALVLRLPSGADGGAVTTLTDDMVARLERRRGPITPTAAGEG